LRNGLKSFLAIILLLMVSACVPVGAATPVTAPAVAPVANAPTQAPAARPAASPTSIPTLAPTSVPTLVPTQTVAPPAAATAPTAQPAVAAACTNQAELVSKTVYPPGNELVFKQVFSLVWQIKNIGTCTWTSGYSMVLVGGEQLTQVSPSKIPQPVPPGGTIVVSFNQLAPTHKGELVQAWMLQDEAGNRFGIGELYQEAMAIPITVRALEAPRNPLKGRDPCY
jgi:hypothetical protein